MKNLTIKRVKLEENSTQELITLACWSVLVGLIVTMTLAAQWTAAESNEEAAKVKLAKEEIYESHIKTQLDQRWYVTEVPKSENALKKIIEELHQKALSPRKTFEYRDRANSVFIWVYHDKETAENVRVFGGDWLGMSAKAPADKFNKVTINSVRLAKQMQPPEVRHGLEEHVRKDIYVDMFNTSRQAWDQAQKEFPNDLVKQMDRNDELVQEHRDTLMERHTLSGDQLDQIFGEGVVEGFSSELKRQPKQTNSVDNDEIIDCEGEAATTQYCIDKEEAFELRARIEALFPTLKAIPSPPWDEDDYLAAETNFNMGVDLYQDEYFGDALPKLKAALDSIKQLEEVFKTTAEDKRAAIGTYFEKSAYGTAVTELNTLLEWFPEDLDLAHLHAEATQGQELKPLMQDLQEYVSNGDFQEVQELLPQFPDGFYEQEISQVQASLEVHRQEVAFNTSMTAGYKDIDAENWVSAEQNIEAALLIRPNSSVAKELLKDVRENHRLDQIDEITTNISLALNEEHWEDVLIHIEEVEKLDIDEAHDFSELEEEVSELLSLELALAMYDSVEYDEVDANIREDIEELLDKTVRLNEFERTQSKRQALADRFEQISTPIDVIIRSDNKTKLRIRPGKEIGTFQSKTLKVLPGTYEVIGTRRGFKQVIHQLDVKPGSEPIDIKVECRVRF